MAPSWFLLIATLCAAFLRDFSAAEAAAAEAFLLGSIKPPSEESLHLFSTCTIDANHNCSAERPSNYPVISTVDRTTDGSSCVDLFNYTRIIDFSCTTKYPGAYYHNIVDCLLPLFGLVEYTRALNRQSGDHNSYKYVLVSPLYLKELLAFFLPLQMHFYHEQDACFTTVATSVSYVITDAVPVATKVALASQLRQAGTHLSPPDSDVVPSILIIERHGASRQFHNSSRIFEFFKESFPGYELVSYHGNETVRTTITLFSRATIIFGYHGAGHVNCIFSAPGTIVVEMSTFQDMDEARAWRSNRVIPDFHTQLKWVVYHLGLDTVVADMDEFIRVPDKDHYIKERAYVDVPMKALINIAAFIKAML